MSFPWLFVNSVLPLGQRWCRSDRSFHHPQHRLGANEIRGRGGHLSDGEDAEDTETSYGADGGEVSFTLYTELLPFADFPQQFYTQQKIYIVLNI